MSKEEILDYVYRNGKIPEEAKKYLDDIDFVIQMLEKESSIMMDLPLDIQKKVLLKDSKYIKDVYDVAKLLEDEEYAKKKATQIYEGEGLNEIDNNAVFYGFTQIFKNGIIKMDSTDMMIEHGKGHLKINSSNCRMRSSDDLAYWTSPDYWNELAQKRKETDIDTAEKLRSQTGTDRMFPSCIVCFDGNINDNSLLAARTHKIPILMINRQQYLDINKQKLEMAKLEFSSTLSQEAMKEIFYRQPYYKIVQEFPNMLNIIKNHQEVSDENKRLSLEYLAYLGQHFIEQSTSGYIIIDVPVFYISKSHSFFNIFF